MAEIIKEEKRNLSSIGDPTSKYVEDLTKRYNNLISQYPQCKDNSIQQLIESLSLLRKDLSNSKFEIFQKISPIEKLLLEFEQRVISTEESIKNLYASKKGVVRLIINPAYLKSDKNGKTTYLDVELTSETDFQKLVEPFIRNTTESNIIYNAVGEYFLNAFGSRDWGAVLTREGLEQLKTIKYEKGQFVEFGTEVISPVHEQRLKQLTEEIRKSRVDSIIKQISLVLIQNKESSLKDQYKIIIRDLNDLTGLGMASTGELEGLKSSISDLSEQLKERMLPPDKREKLEKELNDLTRQVDEINSGKLRRIDELIERYPKLKELMS